MADDIGMVLLASEAWPTASMAREGAPVLCTGQPRGDVAAAGAADRPCQAHWPRCAAFRDAATDSRPQTLPPAPPPTGHHRRGQNPAPGARMAGEAPARRARDPHTRRHNLAHE